MSIWWEKTVEYAYVRHYTKDETLLSPLDGNVEKWLGDLVQKNQEDFTLIEFKRDRESIKTEIDKYAKGAEFDSVKNWFESNADDVPQLPGAKGHWLIYGVEESRKLLLRSRPYHHDPICPNDGEVKAIAGVKSGDFKDYIDRLVKLRGGGSSGSLSGLVLVAVNGGGTVNMPLSSFVEMANPELYQEAIHRSSEQQSTGDQEISSHWPGQRN